MDNGIKITLNQARPTHTYNVDTDQVSVTDGTMGLAQGVGIVDAMHEMNQDARQYDQQLREQHGMQDPNAVPQEHGDYPELDHDYSQDQQEAPKPRKAKKKSKGDPRFDIMTKRNAELSEALEEERQARISLQEQNFLLERQSLQMQQETLNEDINKISGIMAEAQTVGDVQTQIEANKILNRIIADESKTSEALENYDRHLENYEDQRHVPEDPIAEMAYNKLLELSDVKELKSDAYTDWLKDNPYYNPYDPENYDEGLASDVLEIKQGFNKWLKLQRNGNFIGTDEYYDELNVLINAKFGAGSAPEPYQEQYNDPYYDNYPQNNYATNGYEEDMYDNNSRGGGGMRSVSLDQGYGRPHDPRGGNIVTPVSRQGYNTYYGHDQLPSLTPLEESFAMKMPMVDMHGKRLSPQECVQEYKKEKANMMGGR